MILTVILYLDGVKVSQLARCVGQSLVSSKVFFHTHTHQTDCSTWTIELVGKSQQCKADISQVTNAVQ